MFDNEGKELEAGSALSMNMGVSVVTNATAVVIWLHFLGWLVSGGARMARAYSESIPR